MIEQQTKEFSKFSKYYNIKDQVLEHFLRSDTYLPFGLESLKYPIIFTESTPLNAPASTDFTSIFINPSDKFFSDINVNFNYILTFVLLHEIGHNIFMHKERGEGKDQMVWQYAIDFFLNLLLYNLEKEKFDDQANLIIMQLDKYTDKILFNTKFNNMIEEEIYALLQKDGNCKKEETQQSYKDFLDNVGLPSNGISEDSQIKITKTEFTFDGKTEKKTIVEFPKSEINKQEKETNSQFDSNLAKMMFETRIINKGFQNSEFEKFIKRIFKTKIDWQTILRDSILIELQKKSDISYGRPRLIWLTNPSLPYMPNINEEEVYGTAILVIDESGSINDSDIQKSVNIIEQSSSYYKKLIVIKHDTKITWEKEFEGLLTDKDTDKLFVRRSCGGTSHHEVFQRIIELSKQSDTFISIVICVTDLWSDIEKSQKILPISIPRIYISNNKEYDSKNIIGKVINIE